MFFSICLRCAKSNKLNGSSRAWLSNFPNFNVPRRATFDKIRNFSTLHSRKPPVHIASSPSFSTNPPPPTTSAQSFADSASTSRQTEAPPDTSVNYTYRFICDKIRSGGPITVHEFMQLCVGGAAGYYSNFVKKDKIFGDAGDFVTSPELSQLFGEMIAVWIVAELECTGFRGHWQLVELGGGSGILMRDILKALKRFQVHNFDVRIVEISEALVDEQRKRLCPALFKGKKNTSKRKDGKKKHESTPSRESSSAMVSSDPKNAENNVRTSTGVPIKWHYSVDEVPERFSIFVANEFFDALPIHQFRREGSPTPTISPKLLVEEEKADENPPTPNPSDDGWREVYVNLDEDDELCLMLSKSENVHTKGLLPDYIRNDPKRTQWEVSPVAADILGKIVHRFTASGGFALVVDYGHDGCRPTPSMRAYSRHALVNFLARDAAGRVDITADVDFGHLRRVLDDLCLVFGPVTQRNFLFELGIMYRLQDLLEKCQTDEERDYLHRSFKMLMGDSGNNSNGNGASSDEANNNGGMGTAFKAFALFPKTLAEIMKKRGGAPVGFQTLTSQK